MNELENAEYTKQKAFAGRKSHPSIIVHNKSAIDNVLFLCQRLQHEAKHANDFWKWVMTGTD